MRRIINDDKGQLDMSKIFWLCFWMLLLATNLCMVDHMSSIARSLRIMSAVSGSQPTIVVPATVTPALVPVK